MIIITIINITKKKLKRKILSVQPPPTRILQNKSFVLNKKSNK